MSRINKTKIQDHITSDLSSESDDNLTPSFIFDNLHDKYSLNSKKHIYYKTFSQKVFTTGKRTWKEIYAASRTKGGSELIGGDQLNPDVSYLLPDTKFIILHCKDKFRIIGYRKRREFHILFIDPDGKCYKH